VCMRARARHNIVCLLHSIFTTQYIYYIVCLLHNIGARHNIACLLHSMFTTQYIFYIVCLLHKIGARHNTFSAQYLVRLKYYCLCVLVVCF